MSNQKKSNTVYTIKVKKKRQFKDNSTKKLAYKYIYIGVKYVLCLIKKKIVNEKYKIILEYLCLVIKVLY